MYSTISSITYVSVVLLVTIKTCSGQQDVFRIDDVFPQCSNFPTDEVKDKCLHKECAVQPALFECEAIRCKLQFPIITLEDKALRLQCIQNSCTSIENNHTACKSLRKCEKLKTELLGNAKFIVCISKLFDFVNFEYLLYYI